MTLAVLNSCDLLGFNAQHVGVEVHIGPGLPAFHIVGLPDARVRESRERVRSAINSSGFKFPAARITVNLTPADFPKASGRFDLPIALGILIASGQVAQSVGAHYLPPETRHIYFIGELSLTGALLPTPGCTAIALSLARACSEPRQLVLPRDVLAAAPASAQLELQTAKHLTEVVAYLRGKVELRSPPPQPHYDPKDVQRSLSKRYGCLSEIHGQSFACKALEVAAAGGHSMLMTGPPGVGKSMLAQRFVTLLPPLGPAAHAEVVAIRELLGTVPAEQVERPFRTPHHSATRSALIGGGAVPRPGEITLAHRGVLFLDELAEFKRTALEGLREPLESGRIYISRAHRRWTFPAQFYFIAAMNPCPCGFWGHPDKSCQCPQGARQRYLEKISGPLLDRIDMVFAVLPPEGPADRLEPGPSSSEVQARVMAVQQQQKERQGCLNAYLSGAALDRWAALCDEGQAILQNAAQRWQWSMRVQSRMRRLARSLADLEQQADIHPTHVLAAIQFRQSLYSF